MTSHFDPKLDLVFERTVDVPPEYVWRAWTEPELIVRWFTPAPWTTASAEVELHPGGKFRTVMRSPEGHEMDNTGCFLEVVTNRRLTWTGRLLPGFRPKAHDPSTPFEMTAIIALEPAANGGCKYTATVLHSDEQGRAAHEKMGFHHGWGAALDQLVAMYRSTK